MTFIDKIFNKEIDESIHAQFTRFGPGTYENRALMKISLVKGNLKVNTSYDIIRDITLRVADKFEKIEIVGKVVKDGKKEEIEKKSVSGEELKKICEENTYVVLNLNFGEFSVKVGKNLPKPGSSLKDNFCKCLLPLDFLSLFTDKKDFKKIVISHTFVIEDIVIPNEYKDDFKLARLHSKRNMVLLKSIYYFKREKDYF